MKILKQIVVVSILIFMSKGLLFAQSAGINYQALILNSEEIQIPGADIEENQVALSLEDVSFRFTISNETYQELYVEEQLTTTDENGMVSLIVGSGTPVFSSFDAIVWNGTVKYLNIEIDIHSQNQGYVFLDIQKILYLPQSGTGATIDILNEMSDLSMTDNDIGDIIWMLDADGLGNPSLMVWDGTQWEAAQMDYDPTNELALVDVLDDNDRDLQFTTPNTGDQVWNQACSCLQVFDGASWVNFYSSSANLTATNGINIDATNSIKLGGSLVEPTKIDTDATNTLSINGLQQTTNVVGENVLLVDSNSGVITRTTLSNMFQEEVTLTIAANDGQNQFATPLPITEASKVNVYRNGVRIGFTVLNTTILELEPEAVCYAGDEIRIVQFSN